jgi:hypothetical protein
VSVTDAPPVVFVADPDACPRNAAAAEGISTTRAAAAQTDDTTMRLPDRTLESSS